MKEYTLMIGGHIGVGGTPLKTQRIVDLLNKGERALAAIQRSKDCLVTSAIEDPQEVCLNTYDILESYDF